MAVNKTGKRIGKDRIAVRVELLFVLDEIAETRVKVEEIANTPAIRINENSQLVSTGFPSSMVNKQQVKNPINNRMKEFNMSLENIMADGLAIL